MHGKHLIFSGKPIDESDKALIMLHGRGASAEDILTLAEHLYVDHYTIIAPQATNNSWYPYSFLVPTENNEPYLSSALYLINEIIKDLTAEGIREKNIYFAGFSQGACLTLEYAARHAKRYGGIAAFTGGLIGDIIYPDNYKGNFERTPIFIGTSNPDPHVPINRVNETADILRSMNAIVSLNIFENIGHTITDEEIEIVNEIIFKR